MRPFYYPVSRPSDPPSLTENFSRGAQIVPIQFRIGYKSDFNENTRCWYACWSCWAASGDTERCFRTGSASANEMKSGPTDKQQVQMSEHAEQHSIIWNWARQQDKR